MYKVRKADSITSILLFIFNVFLTEKNVIELPLRKIFSLLAPFQKNESAIRMGLSRGVQNGLLHNIKKENEVYYRLTDLAIHSLKAWGAGMLSFRQRIPLQQDHWDGRWSIAHINAACPEELALSLKKLGFGSWNRQLWISPYDFSAEVSSLAEKYGIEKSVYQFRGEIAGGRDQGEVVAQIWPLRDLTKNYLQYIEDLNMAAHNLDTGSFRGGGVLPFLHLYGLRLFELLQEDPQLPLQLLSAGWPGIQAFQHFMSLRESMINIAGGYIEEILS